MQYNLKYDNFIARCRCAVETVAPTLIYTNTENLDLGFVVMDFVSSEFSDTNLLRVTFLVDYPNENPEIPDRVVVETVSYLNDERKHNKAVVAIQGALKSEFHRKFNIKTRDKNKDMTGNHLRTQIILVK